MRNYSEEIKRTALDKLFRPDGPTVTEVSQTMDIPKYILYSWMRKLKNGQMSNKRKPKKRHNLLEKNAAVMESRTMGDKELGQWLREKGYHEKELNLWEKEVSRALENRDGHRDREKISQKKIKELERELNRKDKALAEMSALVVLKKKLSILLGEEE